MRRVSFRSQDSHHSSSIRSGGNFEPQTPQERTSILPQRSSAQEFRPEPDPKGSREKLRGGDRCTEHVQEPQTELHCENNKTGWDNPWKAIVDGQKGVTRAFRPRSTRKLWGICRSSNPSGISGCRREAVSRDKTTSQVSLSPPCMTTAGAKCRVPADIGTTSDAETLDTGRQGAISPAQRTCGPPLALFAARMPGSFDVESCQTNASFPPREFTRLSTYLLGEFSPHAPMP